MNDPLDHGGGLSMHARVIFVQIKCEIGKSYEVARRLVDDVESSPEVFSTSGDFDLIAKFHLGLDCDPGIFVTKVVQRVEGVVATSTMIGFNAFTPRS